MKTLLTRLWEEPAVAAGALTAIAIAVGELLVGDGLQATDLPAILAPLAAGGITRQLVAPLEHGDVTPPDELPKPAVEGEERE